MSASITPVGTGKISGLNKINIDNQIDAFMSGQTPVLPEGELTFTENKIRPLQRYIADNFTNKESFTAQKFNFVQDLIAKLDPNFKIQSSNGTNSASDYISNAIRHCFKYSANERSDFISLLRPQSIKQFNDFSCLTDDNLSKKLNPSIFEAMNSSQLETFVEKAKNNLGNILTADQKEAILKNPNISDSAKKSLMNLWEKVKVGTTVTIPATISSVRQSVGQPGIQTRVAEHLPSNPFNLSDLKSDTIVTRTAPIAPQKPDILTKPTNEVNKLIGDLKSKVKSVFHPSSDGKNDLISLVSPMSDKMTDNAFGGLEKASNDVFSGFRNALGSLTKTGKEIGTDVGSKIENKIENIPGLKGILSPSKTGTTQMAKVPVSSDLYTVTSNSGRAIVGGKNGLEAEVEGDSPPSPQKKTEPLKKTEQQKKAEITVSVDKIKQHLNRLNSTGSIKIPSKIEENAKLKIGTNQIDAYCLIRLFAEDDKFLADHKDKCNTSIKSYVKDNKLALDDIIKLQGNFDADKNFYINLYEFVLSIANFVAENPAFKNANDTIKVNILNGLKMLIRQTLNYSQQFMKKYDVIDDRMIGLSDNLLLLFHSIITRHANVGKSVGALTDIYDQLVAMIRENIGLYEKLKEKIINTKQGPLTNTEIAQQTEMTKLAQELKLKIAELEKQRIKLENSLIEINNKSDNIRKNVTSKDILTLADKLADKSRNISTTA